LLPAGAGIAASLALTGGNATGLSSIAPGLGGKRLELLGVLTNATRAYAIDAVERLRRDAAAKGLTVQEAGPISSRTRSSGRADQPGGVPWRRRGDRMRRREMMPRSTPACAASMANSGEAFSPSDGKDAQVVDPARTLTRSPASASAAH
jgi:hypothetical protein